MDELPNGPQIPQIIAPLISAAPVQPAIHRPLSYWLRRFLACNPFYLVSAMLLLYGFYRVSIDPNFFNKEVPQLTFNYVSLQVYELLLVGTAIFLRRRQIVYDSTLLVTLENMLVLVPFILISQAALNDITIVQVWVLCGVGGLMVMLRSVALKRFMASLELPTRLLSIGGILLAANMVLPVIYRMLHEHKVGTKLAAGPAYEMNEYGWLLIAPLLCALALFVPTGRGTEGGGQRTEGRGRWLPLGFFSLWLVGTGVHLYCLGYVYDFDLRHEQVVPGIWILLWGLWQRRVDWLPRLNRLMEGVLLIAPLAASFPGISETGGGVFLVLMLLNALIYGRVYWRDRSRSLALHLCLLSLLAVAAGVPANWGEHILPEFTRTKSVAFAGAVYLLAWAKFSRDPKFGLLGGLVTLIGVLVVAADQTGVGHWAVQAGLAFLLMHSLRWIDWAHAGAGALRIVASAFWTVHAFLWMSNGGRPWMACLVGAIVLSAYLVGRWATGNWGALVIPAAGLLVVLSGPVMFTAGKLQEASAGVVAVGASFVLFGLGTVLALTKQRWKKNF